MLDAPVAFRPAPVATPEALSPGAEETARKALAPGTPALYRSIGAKLDRWLRSRGWQPSDTSIAEFLVYEHERGLSPGTISLTPAAVRYSSKMTGRPDPCGPQCKRVLAGIRRDGAGRGAGQVAGIGWADVEAVAAVALAGKPDARAYRDVALVRIASDCLLRVSELVALQVDDVAAEPDGTGRLTVRRSKTDQEGKGAVLFVGEPTMQALRDWQEAGGVASGPLFRRVRRGGAVQAEPISRTSAREIIKARAAAAGIKGRLAGHSPRVGSACELASRGAGLVELQSAGRWASPAMPGHYARAQYAGTGAVARLRYSRG